MKYQRLTKEQFEELHQEFINFLATQSIDNKEWDNIKKEKPLLAEQELDVFSDLIWEGVLNNATFLNHVSNNHLFLFKIFDSYLHTIIIKTKEKAINFLTKEGLEWLGNNLFSETIEITTGTKNYTENRNYHIFELIKQGAILSDGKLYTKIKEFIEI